VWAWVAVSRRGSEEGVCRKCSGSRVKAERSTLWWQDGQARNTRGSERREQKDEAISSATQPWPGTGTVKVAL
jgi:hypothetical protein